MIPSIDFVESGFVKAVPCERLACERGDLVTSASLGVPARSTESKHSQPIAVTAKDLVLAAGQRAIQAERWIGDVNLRTPKFRALVQVTARS
jgi:hypothetical protein